MDQDVVPRRGLQDGFSMLDRVLVVMIEEVDHHAAPPHFFKPGESLLHPSAQGALVYPGPKPNVLGLGVVTDRRQIKIGPRAGYIGVRARRRSQRGLEVPRRDVYFVGSKRMGGDAGAGAE